MMRPLNTARTSAKNAANDVLRNSSVSKLTTLRHTYSMHVHLLRSNALFEGCALCSGKCWGVAYYLPYLPKVAVMFVQVRGQL